MRAHLLRERQGALIGRSSTRCVVFTENFFFTAFAIEFQQRRKPFGAENVARLIRGFGCGIGEIQLVLHRQNIVRLDFVEANFHFFVGFQVARARRLRVECVDFDATRAEQIAQADNRAAFGCRRAAVFVVHVENQVDNFGLMMNQAAQNRAREKGFARAAFAENAVAPLHKLRQVDANRRGFHVERRADVEPIGIALAFASEDALDIFIRGAHHARKMRRHGFDRQMIVGFRTLAFVLSIAVRVTVQTMIEYSM